MMVWLERFLITEKVMSDSVSPAVSIIMNCYNSDRFLREAIDSVYGQSFKDWEIVFWDNASTDSSAEIAQSYDERVRYFLAPNTTPLGEARNCALKQARGQYIAFLDCDDLYFPDKLAKQVKLMEDENYVMCYGSALIIDEHGNEIRRAMVSNSSGYIFDCLLKQYDINMQSVMLRRSTLKSDGLSFEAHLQFGPDYNLYMEIAAKYPIGVMRDVVVKTRVLSDSLSRKTLHLVPYEIKYALDRIFTKYPELQKKYPDAADAAYLKLNYYEAVSLINTGKYKQARSSLLSIINLRWEYAFLYLLLFLPLSPNFILRLLKR